MFEKLILVRHGQCEMEDSRPLTQWGREQITQTAGRLRQHVDGKTAAIVSSTFLRARMSAKIIADALGTTFTETNDLKWALNEQDMFKGFQVVQAHQERVQVLILVVHLEHLEDFPNYYGKQAWGKPLGKFGSIDYGDAVVIDIALQTANLI